MTEERLALFAAQFQAAREWYAHGSTSLGPEWANLSAGEELLAEVRRLQAEAAVREAMIHDLKEESTAYQRGVADEREIQLEATAAAVRLERELCALLVESMGPDFAHAFVATAIRGRSQDATGVVSSSIADSPFVSD